MKPAGKAGDPRPPQSPAAQRSKRTYTPEQKAQALTLYASVGLSAAASDMEMPKATIEGWAKAAGIRSDEPKKTKAATETLMARAKEMRAELRVRMLAKCLDLIDRMDAPHVDFKGKDAGSVTYPVAPAAAVQNYATSIGILLDKVRLEAGEATGRVETITDGMNDHEKEALRRVLKEAAEAYSE